MNALDHLKLHTKVVADTGDFEAIEKFQPLDATTNPSLILKSSSDPKYRYILEKAIGLTKNAGISPINQLDHAIDLISVLFGLEILKKVPGRVSTEVNADFSFDTAKTIKKARHLIGLYESFGIKRERVLIKIAATWEGIKAAEVLEREDIHTNLTLVFSKYQAIACAEAGVTLISPFVGRILDWNRQQNPDVVYTRDNDPGVLSVHEIFNYFKKFSFKTEIMGASFRNTGQILELAGCDLLTISPALLDEFKTMNTSVEKKLDSESAKSQAIEKIDMSEELFRWELNADEMATAKLAEGIRLFYFDLNKLKLLISNLL